MMYWKAQAEWVRDCQYFIIRLIKWLLISLLFNKCDSWIASRKRRSGKKKEGGRPERLFCLEKVFAESLVSLSDEELQQAEGKKLLPGIQKVRTIVSRSGGRGLGSEIVCFHPSALASRGRRSISNSFGKVRQKPESFGFFSGDGEMDCLARQSRPLDVAADNGHFPMKYALSEREAFPDFSLCGIRSRDRRIRSIGPSCEDCGGGGGGKRSI